MLGFLFGTFCFFMLVSLVAGPRCHPGYARHHRYRGFHGGQWDDGSRHRGRGRRRGRRGFGRAASEIFKRRLDLDEDQSDLIDHALADLRGAMKGFGTSLKDGRDDLAAAFEGDKVDDAALAALFETQDEELKRFRREAVSALKQIHAVLEPDQRELASEWLANHKGGWA